MQSKPFDSFLDQAPMPIAIFDSSLRFVKVNEAMTEAHRILPDVTISAKHWPKSCRTYRNRFRTVLLEVLNTGEPAVATINGDFPAYSGAPTPVVGCLLPVR